MQLIRPLVLLLLVSFVVGCANKPKLVAVTGKVIHDDKGLTAGSIYFHPAEGNPWQGEKPSSLLQLDGSFTMKTFPHGNGVPPGSYKVTLAPELANRISRPECCNPKKTPLSIDVPDGGLTGHLIVIK